MEDLLIAAYSEVTSDSEITPDSEIKVSDSVVAPDFEIMLPDSVVTLDSIVAPDTRYRRCAQQKKTKTTHVHT